MSTPAGDARLRFGVDDKSKSQLKKIEERFRHAFKRMATIAKTTAKAAVAIGAPLALAARQFAKTGDKIGKFAKRTNLSTDAAQSFGFAMEQSGSSMESLEPAIKAMNRNLLDFERGSKEAKDNFAELGIEFGQFANQDTAGRFRMILDSLKGIEDGGRRAALANKILGRGGADLLPLLGNLEELEKQYESMGTAMTKEQIEKAEEMTDAFNVLGHQFKSLVIEIGSDLVPVFMSLAEVIGDTLELLKDLRNVLTLPEPQWVGDFRNDMRDMFDPDFAARQAERDRIWNQEERAIERTEQERSNKKIGKSIAEGILAATAGAPRAPGLSQGLQGVLSGSGAGLRSSDVNHMDNVTEAVAGLMIGVANAAATSQTILSLSQFTAGSLGTAAGIGAVGGASSPLEQIGNEQVDILDEIKDGIDRLVGRQ